MVGTIISLNKTETIELPMGEDTASQNKKSPEDRDPKTFGTTEFLSKACLIYLCMTALGLFIMRYGHRNLDQVLPWPTGKLTSGPKGTGLDLPSGLLGTPSEQGISWTLQASQWASIKRVFQALSEVFPALIPYRGTLIDIFLTVACAFLSALILVALAYLSKDLLRQPLGAILGKDKGEDSKSKEARSGPKTAELGSSATRRSSLEGDPDGEDYPFALIVEKLSRSQMILLAFVTACGEEILFRGAIQPYVGLFVGSILYGVLHLGSGGIANPLNLMGFIRGLFLGWIFLATQNLWICIAAEFAFNLYALVDSQKQVNSDKSLSLAKQT